MNVAQGGKAPNQKVGGSNPGSLGKILNPKLCFG